ncbi:hypothetical protein L226DRAFT_533429 [Lentinus tigrinus ALCF2SS1-7]|uniref:Uncharacterized protein n=1 Tax=Lentinus tigrinus ALCF2SS1-6 TaxID=1328759 RepID=A0A5C2SJX2_9APHY|nr:hypothetical protein L227DRAFT_571689 [Lentinus tigrinus ALCF2SS1-6]RPD76315.1 hypothetical protein L226DRAFT_533429 [Lentinus tigrinus ALCF2SS1-7]
MASKKISSTTSTATLDIADILSGSSLADDSLLATRLSFSSLSASSHSFDDIPPFPPLQESGRLGPSTSHLCASLADDPLLVPHGRCLTAASPASPAKSLVVEHDTSPGPQPPPANVATFLNSSNVGGPDDPAHDGEGSVTTYVPTITVSNSSAVLPVSLESSQNLHHELPLAVRRGKNPPPALSLCKSAINADPYPDIPSAFLGSPSPGCQSPTFRFSSGDPSQFTMGLSAMCNSLKALVPPPPFTPTECDPPRPKMKPETRWGMVSSAQLPEVDEDEWAFAQDLVVEWHASRSLRAEISPPPSPAGELPYAGEVATPITEGFISPVSSPPALSDSPSGESSDGDQPPQTPANVKQLRRKTVIIQAPESDASSSVELEKVGKVQKIDKLIPSAAHRVVELLPDDFDQPVPFETPAWTQAPALAPASVNGVLPTPPVSRPFSTSSAKLPVRGILKEKKSVRFSSVPSLHEYSVNDEQHSAREVLSEQPDGLRPCTLAFRRHLEPANHPGDKHASLTAAPLRSSPLRECHSATSSGPDGDSSAPKHQPYVTSPPTTPLPPTPSSRPGGTMAKHPAVRALARRPQAYRSSAASNRGSGEGGAVVGAPELQPPTPVLLEAHRRAPLKSINIRQRMPIQRKPDVLIPVKRAPPSMHDTHVPGARRTSKPREQENFSARVAPGLANLRHQRDENARRRSGWVAKEDACGGAPMHSSAGVRNSSGSSRMPVPLRSILTKLRV